jgi:hypothetical protein
VERHHKFANMITTTVMRLILTNLPRKASRLDVSNGSKAIVGCAANPGPGCGFWSIMVPGELVHRGWRMYRHAFYTRKSSDAWSDEEDQFGRIDYKTGEELRAAGVPHAEPEFVCASLIEDPVYCCPHAGYA